MLENHLDNIDATKGQIYEVKKGETLGHVTKEFGLKYSEVEKTFKTEVREGDRFGFVKLLDGKYQLTFTRGKNTANIMLDKNAVFLEKYEFSGFSFRLKKDVGGYKLLGEKGNDFYGGNFRIPPQNLDAFIKAFDEISGKILTEGNSIIGLNDLKVEIKGQSPVFEKVFNVNSNVSLDFITSKIDMRKFEKLIKPELSGERDLERLLRFFLENLTKPKSSHS